MRMETIWQDLKVSMRALRRSPGFALAAVSVLALGIAANSVMFSVVNAVLLNPLAFQELKDPDRLVMIWEANPSLTLFFANRMPPRLRSYRAWREQTRSFEDIAVWSSTKLTLTAQDDRAGAKPEQVEAGRASSNFFPLLGTHVRMGRGFTEDEMKSGQGQVAILSDELYKSRFQEDAHILGRTLIANGTPYRIIGVMPRGFQLPAVWGGFDEQKPKLWVPLEMHPDGGADEAFNNLVFGRLRPGVTLAQARAEMKVAGARLAAAVPDKYAGFGVNVSTLAEEDVGPDRRWALAVLQVAVLFVLLIACANVGNLLLARGVARDKEVAVRSALGASRGRLFRQMLTESALLSLMAAGVGLLVSFAALRALSVVAPADIHGLHELRIDASVLAFTVGLAMLAGILFGLAPALQSLKSNLGEVLNRTTRSVAGSSRRVRNALVTAEVALSLVLLIGAGLMIRTFGSLMSQDLGFRRDHLLIMRIELPEHRYAKAEQIARFNQRLVEGVRQIAGVQKAALTNALPMKSVNQSSFEIPGRSFPAGTFPVTDWARTSDGYFETLGIRLIEGRTYTREEALAKAPDVAVVNQAFARTYFPSQNMLGKVIVFGNEAGGKTNYRVIGAVADERQLGPDADQHPEVYTPGSQLRGMLLAARTSGDPLALAPAVKQQVWNLDQDQPVTAVDTGEGALREFVAPRRFNMIILLNFAGVALLLAAIGLYSVLAYSVTLRTREIGIRIALGAEPRSVAGLVVRQGLGPAITGIALGLMGALALTRFMHSLLFGVSPMDPVTFLAVPALLACISLAASYVPAWRAAKVDPIKALRVE